MYAKNDRISFEEIPNYMQMIASSRDNELHEIPCIIVGNKVDLVPTEPVLQSNEQQQQQVTTPKPKRTGAVTFVELQELAYKYGSKYTEASALNGTNVMNVFEELATMILKKRAHEPKTMVIPTNKKNSKKKGNCVAM